MSCGTEVGGDPVVPEGDAAGLPVEAHGVGVLGDLGEEQIEDARLSSGLTPMILSVKPGFTNRARSPVSGWTRTTGWRAISGLAAVTLLEPTAPAGLAGSVAVLGPSSSTSRRTGSDRPS